MPTSRKKILIINSHFGIGGIETAMVNMANELCNYYDVDLFVYYPEGPMKERLDSRVNVLEPCFAFKAIGMSLKQAVSSKNILIFLFKLFGSLWSSVFDNRLPIFIATRLQKKLVGYDLAIAYRQEVGKATLLSGFARALDYCVEAKTKAVWIHYDATYFSDYQKFNKEYYQKADKIVGVSKSVAEVYKTLYPEDKEKIDYCYNFMDYGLISEKSLEEQNVAYPSDKFICFSACRLEEKQKRVVRAVKAVAPVLEKNKDVLWYIAGDGPDRKSVEDAIDEVGMKDRIILLGNQSNPYPYMKNADLYLSLSLHEAAPMVYMEAKALHVPIFTTRTISSDEMLCDGVNAFICENSQEGITEGLSEIINNRQRVYDIKNSLKDYYGDNKESLDKIRDLI